MNKSVLHVWHSMVHTMLVDILILGVHVSCFACTCITVMMSCWIIMIINLTTYLHDCTFTLFSYVANKLLAAGGQENLYRTVEHIKSGLFEASLSWRMYIISSDAVIVLFNEIVVGIRYMVKNQEPLIRDEVKVLERRLDVCRNPENNPHSEAWVMLQYVGMELYLLFP